MEQHIAKSSPLRVDFAGGWLDVPRLARPDGLIVNCSIVPGVTIEDWPYEKNSGLGGSAAWAFLQGENPIESELNIRVGWQDPAVIIETGLCVWVSGFYPKLLCKFDPEFLLKGRMALLWTGKRQGTNELAKRTRDYNLIAEAGKLAHMAVKASSIRMLMDAIDCSYTAQVREGMSALPEVVNAARKYCGKGWGGYALYYFPDQKMRDEWCDKTRNTVKIEPYFILRWQKV